MAIFSVTDAAFAGFRLLREHPKAILFWATLQTAATLILSFLLLGLSASQTANFQILEHPDPNNPQAAVAAMVALGPMFLVLLVFAVAVSAVLQTAAYRAFLTPSDDRWGYLRLGRAEVRTAAVMVVLGSMLVLFVLVLVFVVAMGVAIGHLLPVALHGVVNLLAFVGTFVALAFVFARFSLAAPASFAEGRLQVMRSWKMTEGHVTQLLSAYLLMWVTLLAMLLLVVLIFAALMGAVALLTGNGLPEVAAALQGGANLPLPLLLLNLAFSIFQLWLIAAATAVQIGPSAESYRELAILEGAAPAA